MAVLSSRKILFLAMYRISHTMFQRKPSQVEARAFCRRRREDWDVAFHCLYQQLRNGDCDAFYYVSPQVRTP